MPYHNDNPNVKEALAIIDEEVSRGEKEMSMVLQGHEIALKEIADLAVRCMNSLKHPKPQLIKLKMIYQIAMAGEFDNNSAPLVQNADADQESEENNPW
jgi:hypothetical protein